MELKFSDRLHHAFNAFFDPNRNNYSGDYGSSYGYRPDRMVFTRGNEKTITNAIYNRIALDVAAIEIKHVMEDENGIFKSLVKSGLNQCLQLEANIDQTSRAFIQDIVISLFDEGSVAVLPVDTTLDPSISNSYQINTMRVAQILDWYPKHVRIKAYNDRTGLKEELLVPKTQVAIIENPLYSVINEPNSTMKRLVRKLRLLDIVDEQSSSGKLDLIIQLPYAIKSDARRQQAEKRRQDIENQLSGTKYGIAYTDGTEKITQLNRSLENNLKAQVEFLTRMLYSQLGITQEILEGTADEQTMLNYYNRTVEPILSAIVDELKRKFLTKTARTQGQNITFFRDPFKLVPVNDIAEIADKFTRNEILSPNEVRRIVGLLPSTDPQADELRNRNISAPTEEGAEAVPKPNPKLNAKKGGKNQNEEI